MKTEWTFQPQTLWSGLTVQAGLDEEPGERLDEAFLESCRAQAAAWDARPAAYRAFGPSCSTIAFYDAEGVLQGRSKVQRAAYRPGRSFEGELGAALDEFHRMVPLSEVFTWRAGDGATHAAFVFARPVAWPHLLSLSLTSPLGPVLHALSATPNAVATAFAFSNASMELCVRPIGRVPTGSL